MEGLFGVIFIVVLFYVLFKSFGKKTVPDENEEMINTELIPENNYVIDDISDQLNKVNGIMEQIKNVEELITDIEICEPGIHSKMFTLTWLSESGKNLSFQFLLNGGEELNTDLLLKLSYAQRRSLRTLLKKEIKNLGQRSNENCYDNYYNLSRGEQ